MSDGSLDANIILRAILGDVPSQSQAAVQLITETKGQLSVADLVFVEIEYALTSHYKLNRAQTIDLITSFIEQPKINCNRPLLNGAIKLYSKYPKLSFTDCCLAEYVELNNSKPLWTFDQKLANQAQSAKLLEVVR